MKKILTVELTAEEIEYAAETGLSLRKHCFKNKGRDRKPLNKNKKDELATIEGAIGEYAVAKAFGIEWDPQFFTKEKFLDKSKRNPDVGAVEVRTSFLPFSDLKIQKSDNPDLKFILVLGHELPKVHIVGWAFARDAQKQKFWKDMTTFPKFPHPCFLFPRSKLRPMDEIGDITLRNSKKKRPR